MSRHTVTRMQDRRGGRGFGLIEVLVGVTIAALALLIIYQVLALAEGYRRTAIAGGEAQSSGMISSFVLAKDLSNSGHTISESATELANCPSTGSFASTWRPIPVLITDGGDDFESDSFALFGGSNHRLTSSLQVTTDYVPGGNVTVQSPLGYQRSHATESPHLFVIADGAASTCEVARVSPWPSPPDPVTGVISVTPLPGFINAYPERSSWVVNLGPFDRVRKIRYDVAGDVLRRTDLMAAGAPVPNPVVSNIVLMKAQYGIDTDADTSIDTWVSARNAPWAESDVLGAPLAQLRQIKAIRLALVVRRAQFERRKDAEGRDSVTDLTADFTTTLFPCHGLRGCTGETRDVVIPGTAHYRYRVFEQVIPLTNPIWNPL